MPKQTFNLAILDDLDIPPGAPDEWEVHISEDIYLRRSWYGVSQLFQGFIDKGKKAGYVMTSFSDASNRRFIFHGKRAPTALPELPKPVPTPTLPRKRWVPTYVDVEVLPVSESLPTTIKQITQ